MERSVIFGNMKFVYFLILLVFFTACTAENEVENDPIAEIENQPKPKRTKDEILRHIESQLHILGTEKYGVQYYKAQLTDDDVEDQIITVNLLDRAKNDAIESGQVAKRASVGYMGNYNFFFFVDGATDVITSPITIPSSPMAEIEISFENITTEAKKDLQIDFKIGDSKYRAFYTIEERAPFQIGETELYQEITTDSASAYIVKFEEGTHVLAKNIVIYKGLISKVETEDPDEIYTVEPEIKATDELVRRWYYSPQHKKYYLKKDEL